MSDLQARGCAPWGEQLTRETRLARLWVGGAHEHTSVSNDRSKPTVYMHTSSLDADTSSVAPAVYVTSCRSVNGTFLGLQVREQGVLT